MGTRSTTQIVEKYRDREVVLVNMYRQFDGYPEGHGAELVEFLTKGPVINGFSSKDQVAFNGAGCLAAQMVAEFKGGIGGFYLVPPTQKEEYNYRVVVENNKIHLTVTDYNDNVLYEGDPAKFGTYFQTEENNA